MEQMFKKLFSITALLSVAILQASSCDNCCSTSPYFSPRSQGRDKTRQMVGTVDKVHLYDQGSWYANFSVMFEYTRSFRSHHIAECLLGCSLDCNCDCPTFRVQGSDVENRTANAWLADYFYLPTDFSSTVQIKPRIENFLVDFDLYVGLDEWVDGLYFRIYGPVTHTRWDLNFCESVEAKGTNSHAEGYFNPTGMTRDKLLGDFTAYITGRTSPATIDGVSFQALKCGRWDTCRRTETGFADLRFELGWNFWQDNDYHFGLNLQFAAPTGNSPECCYFFDALVGNGNHWEAGGGLTAHYLFWRSKDEEQQFGFYFDANVTHLFKARNCRTFDLCGKPLSRYMLASKMTKTIIGNLEGDSTSPPLTAPSAQFALEYSPVANLTTVEPKVSIGVQGDVVAMFNYSWNQFSWDFGYNFWGRSCEKFDCLNGCGSCCSCNNLCDGTQNDTWVLKGDSHMFGFVGATSTNIPASSDSVALSASQSGAVICKGTNGKDNRKNNTDVDNALFAYGNDTWLMHTPGVASNTANNIKTSVNPVFLGCCDLNQARTKGISHKVFTHLQYTWDRESWTPFLGIGGFAEFGQNDCSNGSSCSSGSCNTSCTSSCGSSCGTSSGTSSCSCGSCSSCCCIKCALSQWGVWVKGGVSFS